MNPNLPTLHLTNENLTVPTENLTRLTSLAPKFPLEFFTFYMSIINNNNLDFNYDNIDKLLSKPIFEPEHLGFKYKNNEINLIPIYNGNPAASIGKNELLFSLKEKVFSSFIKYALCYIQTNFLNNIILLNPSQYLYNLKAKLLEVISLPSTSMDIYSTIYFGILALVLNDNVVNEAARLYKNPLAFSVLKKTSSDFTTFQQSMRDLLIKAAEEKFEGIIEYLNNKNDSDTISKENILEYFKLELSRLLIKGLLNEILDQKNNSF